VRAVGDVDVSSARPRIGVVVPTYNRADLLHRAIVSILDQRSPPDEIVVVDDGSADDTEAVVRSFGGAITYRHQSNRGVAAARNAGVSALSTTYVAFLDDDDTWESGHLERLRAAVDATHESAHLYFSDLAIEDQHGATTAWRLAQFRCAEPHELVADGTPWAMMPCQPMTTQATMIRRAAFLECGGQSERLTTREDTHLFLKLSLGTPVCAVAGVAGVLHADAADARLTAIHQNDDVYWGATAWLYSDILRRQPRLGVIHRRELRRRAAHAHLRLARLALGDRSAFGLLSFARAVRQDPGVAGRRLAALITKSSPTSLRAE
jgi:glycosyltransferase involved in cell wall biosynthesis